MTATMLERNHAETSVDLHFRVFLWLQAHPRATAAMLAEYLRCSPATAYRYTAAYRRVLGRPEAKFDKRKAAISQPRHVRAREDSPVDHPWSRRHAP